MGQREAIIKIKVKTSNQNQRKMKNKIANEDAKVTKQEEQDDEA